jgi:hypothetical protein
MWVKNVYNLGIVGGITRGLLSPLLSPTRPIHQTPVHNQLVLPSSFPTLSLLQSTAIFSQSPLLFAHLFTVSTPPIITKTKLKKERNT